MRCLLPRLAPLLLILLALPTGAFADNATTLNNELRLVVVQFNSFPLNPDERPTKAERLCRKAFKRAGKILEQDTATQVEDAKALKKAVAALQRWLEAEFDTRNAFNRTARTLSKDLEAQITAASDALGGLSPQERAEIKKRDLKTLQKFIDQADKKLAKVAVATAEGNPKKVGSRLFSATKAVAKVLDFGEKILPEVDVPTDVGTYLATVLGPDGNGVPQAIAVSAEDAAADIVLHQLSSGPGDATCLQTAESPTKVCSFWKKNDDLHCSDPRGPIGDPRNLTTNVPPLSNVPYDISPDGNRVVVFTEDGTAFSLDVATGNSFPLGPGRSPAVWVDGDTVLLQSNVQNPAGGRIVLYTLGEAAVAGTEEIAGPVISSVSAFDPAVSSDGRLIAFRSTPLGGGGSNLEVHDRTAGETVLVSDSLVSLRSGQSLAAPMAAGVWSGARTLFFDGVPEFQAVVFDQDAPTQDFEKTVLEPIGANYIALAVTELDAFLFDTSGGELFHVGLPDLRPRYLGPAGNRDPGFAFEPRSRIAAFGVKAAGEPFEIRRYDAATQTEGDLFSPPGPQSAFGNSFLRDLEVREVTEDELLFGFNFVSDDDERGGTYQAILPSTGVDEPLIADALRLFDPAAETSNEGSLTRLYREETGFGTKVITVNRNFRDQTEDLAVAGSTRGPSGLTREIVRVRAGPFSRGIDVEIGPQD